jgi:hypothetical protein
MYHPSHPKGPTIVFITGVIVVQSIATIHLLSVVMIGMIYDFLQTIPSLDEVIRSYTPASGKYLHSL